MFDIFIDMTKPENVTDEYVRRVLKSLDKDLAAYVVLSGVSLNVNTLVKTLIVAADVQYFRNMKADIQSDSPELSELSVDDINRILSTDGWKIKIEK